MRTVAGLFTEAFTFEALFRAYTRARKGKRYRKEVLIFTDTLETNILGLQKSLHEGTYQQGAYKCFVVCDAKKRNIQAAPFRDRVVHQAVHAVLEPVFERSFIFDSYACRKYKGTERAIERLEQFITHDAQRNFYALTGDISKYFASIDHKILLRLLAKRIADQKMLQLCAVIIGSSHEAAGKGIPIGNLTSQLFANIYLHELDCFVKHTLGARKYIRYMDDFILISDDKVFLHDARERIQTFVEEKLCLTLHPKKVQIIPVRVGIEYLGYRVLPHYRKLRKSTVQRFVMRIKHAQKKWRGCCVGGEHQSKIQSWLVYARRARSRGLIRSLTLLGMK